MLLFVKCLFKIVLSCKKDSIFEQCAGSIKEPFKNDFTSVRGGGEVHANSNIITKKIEFKFFFRLILLGAVAPELWLPFRWGCCFKHWSEPVRAGWTKTKVKSKNTTLQYYTLLIHRYFLLIFLIRSDQKLTIFQ